MSLTHRLFDLEVCLYEWEHKDLTGSNADPGSSILLKLKALQLCRREDLLQMRASKLSKTVCDISPLVEPKYRSLGIVNAVL